MSAHGPHVSLGAALGFGGPSSAFQFGPQETEREVGDTHTQLGHRLVERLVFGRVQSDVVGGPEQAAEQSDFEVVVVRFRGQRRGLRSRERKLVFSFGTPTGWRCAYSRV